MKHKVLTWVFMVALIVGQSYAYEFVPCESQLVASAQQNHNMHNMDQSEHNMMSESSHDMPCCNQECKCPSGTCASVALNQAFFAHSLKITSQASAFYLLAMQDTYLGSLRKPPIYS